MTKNTIRACSHLASLGTGSGSGADYEYSTRLYMWGSLIKKKWLTLVAKLQLKLSMEITLLFRELGFYCDVKLSPSVSFLWPE